MSEEKNNNNISVSNDPNQTDQNSSKKIIHTYEDDMALAMDTTDAKVVKEMLHSARQKEDLEEQTKITNRQRRWYNTGAIILIILAVGAACYGLYYYKNLTVPVSKSPSVGIFPNSSPIYTNEMSASEAIEKIMSQEDLTENKPTLVPLLLNKSTMANLTTDQIFKYFNIPVTEPFVASISLLKLGVMNNGKKNNIFLIYSTSEPENASKELLIAEPTLLNWLNPIFHIEVDNPAVEISPKFTSTFMYNLPIRILTSKNIDTGTETVILYYGYATNNTIVIAADPSILKAVYDTIIRQN